jgi:hypothetical protein
MKLGKLRCEALGAFVKSMLKERLQGEAFRVGRAASQRSASWVGSYALGGGLQVYVPEFPSLLAPGGP